MSFNFENSMNLPIETHVIYTLLCDATDVNVSLESFSLREIGTVSIVPTHYTRNKNENLRSDSFFLRKNDTDVN